jgi:hypothetical protein
MKKHLMIAALAAAGLAACGEDRAVQTGAPTSPPAQTVQPAAQPAPAAQDEKKEVAAPESKGETSTPRDEEKKDEGAKKAD